MTAMKAAIVKLFGAASPGFVAPPLLRAGATLSEAESLQRFASPAHANAPIQTIDVQTAVSARNRVYVDLRPPAEQARTGKICGAVSAPFYTRLPQLAAELTDRDVTYVLYAGASTPDKPQKAGAVLRELGYRHVAALPSYEDWLAARAPVEHVAPRRTQRASASAAA